MKETTHEWILAAEEDLMAAKMIANVERLTNLAAFHCQQCVEKCLKSVIENQDKPFLKSHDLIRLNEIAEVPLSAEETELFEIINEVYIDSRYPGDTGLLPQGKPTIKEIGQFIAFCDSFIKKISIMI